MSDTGLDLYTGVRARSDYQLIKNPYLNIHICFIQSKTGDKDTKTVARSTRPGLV